LGYALLSFLHWQAKGGKLSSMSEAERRGEGKRAALRRFPDEARLIEELAARSENFRDMCDELAEVERALLATKDVRPEIREERIAEWTGWVDRLTAEIAAELRKANVIPLDRGRPPGRRP
jgi:hypothetical protein